MTEESFYHDGYVTGDAVLAPYTSDEFREVWRRVMLYDEATDGKIAGGLFPSTVRVGVSTITLKISPGTAILRGVMYINDGLLSFSFPFPTAGAHYYTIVLRLYGSRIRMVALGPNTATYPAITQTDFQYELPIARVKVEPFGVNHVYPAYHSITPGAKRSLSFVYRLGGDADAYATAGGTAYTPTSEHAMQVGAHFYSGAFATSGNFNITFPVAFEAAPIVIVDGFSTHPICLTVGGITTGQFTAYWTTNWVPDGVSQIYCFWTALGKLFYR